METSESGNNELDRIVAAVNTKAALEGNDIPESAIRWVLENALAVEGETDCATCGGSGKAPLAGAVHARSHLPCPAGCVNGKVKSGVRMALIEPFDGWRFGIDVPVFREVAQWAR
jgi:hypothetical protein